MELLLFLYSTLIIVCIFVVGFILQSKIEKHIPLNKKDFDIESFKEYINNIPENESINIIKIIYENKLLDCKFKLHLDKWFKI